MQAEILIVPTPASLEMLKKSAQELAKNLVANRITVHDEISLCPDKRRLQHAISKSLGRSDILFTVGGMGRDSQFLAKTVMCEGLGLPLEHSPETFIAIQDYVERSGLTLSPTDATLASLPAGSKPLFPTKGIIPGCIISSASQHIVMLPENGVEILPMLTRQVIPYLSQTGGLSAEFTHEIRSFGLNEEQVDQLVADLTRTSNPVVRTYSQGEEVVVQVTASANSATEAADLASPVLRTIVGRLGDHAYGFDVNSLEQAVVQKMDNKGFSMSIAEAGTHGNLIAMLSHAPGSRHMLDQLLTPEDSDSKAVQLGLNARQIKKRGDVSEYTAVNMANSVRELGGSDIGVGITADIPGINQGGAASVYVAVCDNKNVYVKKLVVDQTGFDDYEKIVNKAILRALNMIRLFVDYLPEVYPGSVALNKALDGKITVTDKDSYQDDLDYKEDIPNDDYQEYNSDNDMGIVSKKKKKKRKKKSKNKKEKTPKKAEGKAGKVKKTILIIAVIVFVSSLAYLGWYGFNSLVAYRLRDNLAEVYEKAGIAGLKSLNPDTVGFISLEGTDLKYPVVQAGDNDFYLRRNFNKQSNWHGVPFLDYKDDIKKPSENLIIYGHNMRDGQIFGELLNYKKLEYYKEHPVIQFESSKKPGDYKVFSVFLTSADPSHFDDGNVFEYHKFIDSASDEEYDAFIKQVRVRSIINAPVDIESGDEIIMLSTCDYDLHNSRFVVAARRVRTGESTDVDTDSAEKNPQPLYPDIWYKTYSGYTKPDVESWNYTPSATSDKKPEKSSDDTDSKVSPESSERSSSEDSSTASKVDSKADDAASKAAEDKAKKEAAAAESSKAAEEAKKKDKDAKKKAEEESKAAEASKLADEKKKEEDAKKKAEEEKSKQDAEDNAVAASRSAKTAAEDAASYQRSALNAENREQADKFAESAKGSASTAETAATTAETAAQTAGTQRAKDAAESARKSATDARTSANTAVENAQNKSNNVDVVDTAAKVKINSTADYNEDDTLDIVSRIVQQEIGSYFHPEAIKAQAVATYTFIKQANASGSTPYISMAKSADAKVKNAVSEVLGQAVYYNGSYAFTPYHATSAGKTTTSSAVWGGNYPYLVSVDSSVDKSAKGYTSTTNISSDKVSEILNLKLGIETTGDPSTWFNVLTYEEGGYKGKVSVCGESKSRKNGSDITGRLLREQVFGLRSAAFDIDYNSSSDSFTFTTYGYGHGVGLSQTGANSYANQGWSYKQILQHYYSGTTIK